MLFEYNNNIFNSNNINRISKIFKTKNNGFTYYYFLIVYDGEYVKSIAYRKKADAENDKMIILSNT